MDRTPRRPLIARLMDLLLAAFILLVAATAAIDTILPLTGHPVVIIAGASMEPAIPIGSIVIEERPGVTGLSPGDVASFRLATGATITHRVTRTVERSDGTWYELKGDANASPDPVLLPAASAQGRVLVGIPLLGYLIWLLHLPIGIVAVVTAALALYIAGILVDPDEEPDPDLEPDQESAGGPVHIPA